MADPFHHKHPYLTVLMVLVTLLVVTDFISDWLWRDRHHDGFRYGPVWHEWARQNLSGKDADEFENKPLKRGAKCGDGLDRWAETRLFMGRGSEGGQVVSDDDFEQFLDNEIRTRFPDGFTVLDAGGHWGSEDGKRYSEQTKLLLLLHDGSKYDTVDEIGEEYLEQFDQSSVLRADGFACVKFIE
jgi:hypothetical protein